MTSYIFIRKAVTGKGELPGDYFWHVQVDNGKYAPPIQITIRGNSVEKYYQQDEFYSIGLYQKKTLVTSSWRSVF